MGYDLVTWSPAIGGGGDDNYNIPGATKLDDTIDAGGPSRIDAGASAFSAVPTIAELNASAGVNQIIGLINRRIDGFKAAFPSLLYPAFFTALPYVAPDATISHLDIPSIPIAINAIRQAEGFADYTFDANPAGGAPISGKLFSQFRKALRIAGVSTRTSDNGLNFATGFDCTQWKFFGYQRVDNPWNTLASEVIAQTAGDVDCGKKFTSATDLRRRRILYSVIVPPDWTIAAADVHHLQYFSTGTLVSTLESFDLRYYSRNGSEWPRTVAGSSDLDNLESSQATPAENTQYSFAINPARFAAKAGSWFNGILTTAHEADGNGVSVYSSNQASGYSMFNLIQGNNAFIVDFGA